MSRASEWFFNCRTDQRRRSGRRAFITGLVSDRTGERRLRVADEGRGRMLAQVIAVEQRGTERPFVSLDDLERLAADDASSLPRVLVELRRVFDGWEDRTGGVYVHKG